MLETSYFTEALLLMAWGFVPWFTYYTFKESGHSLRKSVTALLLVFAWAFAALGIVKYGFDAFILGDSPLRPVVYLSLGVGLAWAFRWRIVGKGLSQHILIGLQLARPIGMVFVVEQFRGLLPGSFAGPAGWGDLTVGLIALYVVIRYRNRPVPDGCRHHRHRRRHIGFRQRLLLRDYQRGRTVATLRLRPPQSGHPLPNRAHSAVPGPICLYLPHPLAHRITALPQSCVRTC